MGMAALEAARSGLLKPLRRATISFHLWHNSITPVLLDFDNYFFFLGASVMLSCLPSILGNCSTAA